MGGIEDWAGAEFLGFFIAWILPILIVVGAVWLGYRIAKFNSSKNDEYIQVSQNIYRENLKLTDLADLLQSTHIRKREIIRHLKLGTWQLLRLGYKLYPVSKAILNIANIDIEKIKPYVNKVERDKIHNYAIESIGIVSKEDPHFITFTQRIGKCLNDYDIGIQSLLKKDVTIHRMEYSSELLITEISPNRKDIKDKILDFGWYSNGINSMYCTAPLLVKR